jgi:hypothetical protein
MTEVLAWVWTPVLLLGLLLGVGLLVDTVLRTRLPPALLAPVGLATAFVLVAALGRLGLSARVVTPLLVVAALAGFVVARRGLRARVRAPWAYAAAGAVYLLYIAPVALSGHATWAGYNFVNDTSANFILADLLEYHGAVAPAVTDGATKAAAAFVDIGYPLGAFSLTAAVRPLTGVPLESVYQPIIAVFGAVAAMSLSEVAARCGLRARWAFVAATLPLGGALVYRYALQGSIKEVALVTLCATGAALAAVALERRLAFRAVALVAVVAVAMILVFSAAAAAFGLVLGAGLLVAALLSPHRPSARHLVRLVGGAAVLAVLVLLPTLGGSLDFVHTLHGTFNSGNGLSTGEFGQLLRPLPVTEGAGVWITQDYRLPAVSPLGVNPLLVAVVILAAAAGLAVSLRRRLMPALLLLVVMVLPAALLSPAVSPYIDAKLLMVATPAVVFLALLAGLRGLQGRARLPRVAGAVAVVLVAAGVLASDLYSYRQTSLAPLDRMDAMQDVAAHLPARPLYLFNEWEEFGKYFMRSGRINAASEAESPHPVRLRRAQPIRGHWFDLDEQKLGYVERFAGVIMRRSPAASRPPANFHLVYRNAYYEIWRRSAQPRVVGHLPLQRRDRAAAVPRCADVRALARRARPGDRIVAAGAPRVATLSPFAAVRPAAWRRSVDDRGAVVPRGPGRMTGTLGAAGERQVWVKASGGRALTVYVDGRRVGRVQQFNTPGQWLEAGTVRLAPGAHRIEVRRSGARLGPGDAANGTLGPVALQAPVRSAPVSVAPSRAQRLCGRSWDWIELTRPRGVS